MGIKLRDSFAKMAAAALVTGAALSSSAFAQTAPGSSPAPQTITTGTAAAPSLTNITLNDPVVPYPLILGLGVLFAAAAVAGFRNKMPVTTALRTGAGVVLLTALANPLQVTERRDILPTDVIIIVDKSPSQSIGERQQDTDRAYQDLERQLNQKTGLVIHKREAGASKPGAMVDGTNLFSALTEELSKVPRERLGAVYFITDGQIHDVPVDISSLGPNIPVHGLITGKQGEFDRRIVIDKAPLYGVVNEEESISFHVADDGAKAGAQVRVSISLDGEEKMAKTVIAGQITDVKLKIPHAGVNTIQIKTDPVPGEISALNNNAATEIRGKAKELNVLIVSGAPSSGLRMLRELFKSDPDNTVIHFTTLRNLMSEDDTPTEELNTTALPMTDIFENNIQKYDVIVLDHFNNTGVIPPPYFDNIASYVREGGSLLVINGPEYANDSSVFQSSIGDLLPVVPDGIVSEEAYVPKMTPDGAKHPVTRSLPTETPWGHWYNMPSGQNRTGTVLMEGAQKKPLIVLDRKEKGRVAMIMSDQMWLWAAGHDGGGPYSPLMTNMSRWLLKNPAMEEEVLRLSASKEGTQLIIEQQTMADKSSPVMLRTPSGKSLAVAFQAAGPGLWRASVPVDEPGLYTAVQGNKPPVVLNVGQPNPKEFSSIVATAEKLNPIAGLSSGSTRFLHDGSGNFVVPRVTAIEPGQDNKSARGDDFTGIRLTKASQLRGIDRNGIPPLVSYGAFFSLLLLAYRSEGGKKKKPEPVPGVDRNTDGPAL
ncbi:MAG: Threonine dehydrogenase [Devosia sp.]|uniref:DUF7408 domain-containing protein n=1 Tax=Devosia sp. TaxID=1871048 RepID=UPI0026268A77|nr:hypothetical protein [Devosia sp.]MDB5531644.1 Threonine dehydrogenase [Devosia sp.]